MENKNTSAQWWVRRTAAVTTLAAAALASFSWVLWRCNQEDEGRVLLAHQSSIRGPGVKDPEVELSRSRVDDSDQMAVTRRDELLRSGNYDELLGMLRQESANSASPVEMWPKLMTIAEARPEIAINLAAVAGRTDDEKARWIAEIVRSWAGRDPQQAWEWLMQRSHRLEKISTGGLIGIVLNQMARSTPAAVVGNLETVLAQGSQPDTPAVDVLLHEGINALVANGAIDVARKAIDAWANSSLKDRIGASAFESLALRMAEATPESAASWLKSLPVSDARNFAIGTLASTWVDHDPAAAMDWVESLSPLDGRVDAAHRTFNEWVERAPADAANWLNDHRAQARPGGENDRMITRLVAASPLVRDDPAGALQWAGLIAKPELRAQVIAGVITRWGLSDSTSATQFLQQTADLTVEQKATVLRSWQDPQTADRYAGEGED